MTFKIRGTCLASNCNDKGNCYHNNRTDHSHKADLLANGRNDFFCQCFKDAGWVGERCETKLACDQFQCPDENERCYDDGTWLMCYCKKSMNHFKYF